MRFTINVECSPEEARSFFGFPDVGPMQETLMKEMQDRMVANIKQMDPQNLMKQWLPMSMQAFEQFQQAFWNQAGNPGSGIGDQGSKRKTAP